MTRKFKYIKYGKVEEIFEEKDYEEAVENVLRWNNIEVEEVFENELTEIVKEKLIDIKNEN